TKSQVSRLVVTARFMARPMHSSASDENGRSSASGPNEPAATPGPPGRGEVSQFLAVPRSPGRTATASLGTQMMREPELYFVIPTYRLRDVGETVEQYDEHFWRNGHSPTIVVFDDSSPAAQEKYYPALEQTRTHAELFYVGPKEKEQFI